jgi:hypothetical protein
VIGCVLINATMNRVSYNRIQLWNRPVLPVLNRKPFLTLLFAILLVINQSTRSVYGSWWLFGNENTDDDKDAKKQEVLKKYRLDVANSHNGIVIESNVEYGADIVSDE